MGIYSEEHGIFKESVRRFSERHILPNLNKWEKDAYFPSKIFEELGQAGFLGTLVPEALGGSGGDYSMAAAWCEEFGRLPAVGFTTGVNMHALVITPALARLGSKEAHEKYLQAALEGKAIGAYAFTEPAAGSDLSQIQLRARADGKNFILNGTKIFITNGKRADFVLVLAKTEPEKKYDGYTTFVVDTKSDGFQVSRTLDKLGWHCSDTAELVFNDVVVPSSMILGKLNNGWQQSMDSLEWERLMLTLGAIGGTRACIDQTVSYINDRRIFGRSVGSFQLHREKLADFWSKLESGRALAHQCVNMLNRKERCRKEVSLAKLFVCELAIQIADYCLQLHGGYGYTTEFLPERWLRDLRLNTIGGGTSQVMARIAAKECFESVGSV